LKALVEKHKFEKSFIKLSGKGFPMTTHHESPYCKEPGQTTKPLQCFDIGITKAGAVSAGAYTASAIDFLIEALDTWQGAKRAVLMIDSFPDVPDFTKNDSDTGLFDTLKALLAAVTNNARFKPHESVLSLDETIFIRFIMTPSRIDKDNSPKTPALASGAVCGFAGFLNKDFRRHDYLLGRRNCQKFLVDHFSLPDQNSLFNTWSYAHRTTNLNKGKLPIIPLAPRLLEINSFGWRSLRWLAAHLFKYCASSHPVENNSKFFNKI
jgi:hypothetical protein